MNEIISLQNNTVKEVVKLHQKKYREEFIIVEGEKALNEPKTAGLNIKYVFSLKQAELCPYEGQAETFFVNEKVMEKISTTESAPGILGVVRKPLYNIDDFKKYKKIVLLDEIKDAGNLGTIIRTAAAFDI